MTHNERTHDLGPEWERTRGPARCGGVVLMQGVDPRLAASARLLSENISMLERIDDKRDEVIRYILIPWRWPRIPRLLGEIKDIESQIDANSKRIDTLHDGVDADLDRPGA